MLLLHKILEYEIIWLYIILFEIGMKNDFSKYQEKMIKNFSKKMKK